MSDETDPDALRERVRELEQTADDLRETVEQLQQRRGPSRRDLLKVGSGGLLGAGLLASSQPVSAAPASSDTSAGQVGVAGDSEDVVLDQVFDPGGDEILNVDDAGGINAQFGRTWHFDDINLGSTLDLNGNDLTGVQSLDVESLAVGGTLYEEDDNSPWEFTAFSDTFNLSGTYDAVIIIPYEDDSSDNRIRINGDTGNNYDYVDTSDTKTTGDDQLFMPKLAQVEYYYIHDLTGNSVNVGCQLIGSITSSPLRGSNANISGPISSVEFRSSSSRTVKSRVYGRSID